MAQVGILYTPCYNCSYTTPRAFTFRHYALPPEIDNFLEKIRDCDCVLAILKELSTGAFTLGTMLYRPKLTTF